MQRYFDKITSLFKPRPVELDGRKLYAACVAQARRPVFYLDYGIEDAIGARFELLTFYVGMVIERLRSLGADDPRRQQALDLGQAVFDAFLEALDNTLREQGTGDLSVPKKMKKLGAIIYTRMKTWDDLWRGDDAEAMAVYAAKTIYAGSAYDGEDDDAAVVEGVMEQARAFAGYAVAARDGLSLDSLLRGRADWAEAPALATAIQGRAS